ncbi:MAG: molecular chaperone DnaJ [Patescibacteria group bacterium]
MRDYYEILGIPKNASKEEIKKAYYKLAHKHHPDKTKGDDKKFKEINEAYQVLGDDKKRAEYDAYGRVFGEGGAGFDFGGFAGKAPGWDFSSFDFGEPTSGWDLNDIFENFFSSSAHRKRQKRGRDISIDLEIPFEDSIFGTERRVIISKISLCDECKGTGAELGTKFYECSFCKGTGRVHETRKSFFGVFSTVKECDKCFGKGTVPSKKCSHCKGNGVMPKKEEIVIKIPVGVYDGEMVKITAMGEAITGGIPGDLYVKIHVKPHPVFKREKNNLVMDLNIKISDAILGSQKEIKTLDGIIKIKIPQGIDSGEILRIKGKGVPQPNGSRGDLMIKILVRTPKKVSSSVKKLVEDLQKEGI